MLFNDGIIRSNQVKHFPPAIKEWNNSMYVFNKNTLNLTPVINKTVFNLLKAYFNLYNEELEIKYKRFRARRLSSHKIFISKGEFKHTNNKVTINIYVYNRQKINYLNILSKIFLFLKKSNKKKLNKVKRNASFIVNKVKSYKIRMLRKNINNFNFYENLYKDDYIIACYKKELLYLYYKRLLLLNQLKFRYTYLQSIINLIQKMYNKNININIINLKYFYFNSDILTESITNKLTKNRRRMNPILKLFKHNTNIKNNREMQILDELKTFDFLSLVNSVDNNKIKNYLDENKYDLGILLSGIYSEWTNKKNKILKFSKNKYITGVRIEAAGRLSRRHTASRSIFRLKYVGNLRNRDSSYKGLSSVIMRGNIRNNLQHTKLSSIARIGSFGLKGWVSSN